MKNTFRPLFAVMAIALVASCAEQIENDNVPVSGNLVKMTFSASMSDDVENVDTKTTYKLREVYWEASDAITVFSVGETVERASFDEPELLENGAVARFSGLADPSAETYYAVYPHSDANVYDSGTFSVTFPHTHTAVANGFPSGSNVSIAVSKDAEVTEQNLQFKNVGALLAFSFNTEEDAAKTKSVTFQARKSADDAQTPEFWGLTGNVTVTIDDNGLPVASEGGENHVTLTAPDGGFEVGKDYLIPVCPVGDCAGMVVTFTDQNDNVFVKNNDVDFQLLRSYLFNVGKIPCPYDVLPKEITLMIDLTKNGWSFVEDPATEQKLWTEIGEGDEYTYNYNYIAVNSGSEESLPLTFRIMRSKTESTDAKYNYTVTDEGLTSGSVANSYAGVMYIPGIPNRYLVEAGIMMISCSKAPTGAFGFSTTQSFPGTSTAAGAEKETIFYLYNDKITSNTVNDGKGKAVLSGPAYLRFRWNGTLISYLRLKYSATAPGNAPSAAAE